ncbi:MAG: hypothetical protein H6741_13295 [Alphaproteobacteria bacterium]|nr:hypothetical protein [Alphaproteobacteria bacterium]
MTDDLDDLDYRPGGARRFAPLGVLALLGLGAGIWAWPYFTGWRAYPERWSEAVSAGVDLNAVQLTGAARLDYSYSFSPLSRQLDEEARWLDADVAPIRAFGDRVAEEVAWEMLYRTGLPTVDAAEAKLWEQGRQKEIPELIAGRLRLETVIYGEEELYSRGFDPEANAGDFVHLDCDLIAHVFLHVGQALDLDIREMNSPLHAFLAYGPPGERAEDFLYIEPTEFRSRIEHPDGSYDLRGWDLGELFWITRTFHEKYSRSAKATRALTEAAGFYTEKTEKDLEDTLMGAVLLGTWERLERDGQLEPRRDALLDAMRAQVKDSREPHLVSNLHTTLLTVAEEVLDEDPAKALALAEEALALRTEAGVLIITLTPLDKVMQARALHALGRADELDARLNDLEDTYRGLSFRGGAPFPWDTAHAWVLWLRALDAPTNLRTYNELLLPLTNWMDAVFGVDLAWKVAVFDRAALCVRDVDRARAKELRGLAQQWQAELDAEATAGDAEEAPPAE